MGLGLVGICVVAVVRSKQRRADLVRDRYQVVHHGSLGRDPVIHDLDEVVAFAEDVLVHRGGFKRRVKVADLIAIAFFA